MADVEMKIASKGTKRKGSKSPFKRRKFASAPPGTLRIAGPKKEIKYVDRSNIGSGFQDIGTVNLLNGIIPGTEVYQRVGRRVVIKSILVRGYIIFSQVGLTLNDFLRLMIVYDREPNGATPAGSDILQNLSNAGATTTNSMSAMNRNNSDRFVVLQDWHHAAVVDKASASSILDFQPASFKFYIGKRANGLEMRFNAGTAGTIADIQTGAIYLVTFGLQTAANLQWAANVSTRVSYMDS